MNKLFLKRVIVALVVAVLAPFLILFLLSSFQGELLFKDTTSLSFLKLISMKGSLNLIIALGVFGFLLSFVSILIAPSRRRRYRSVGTLVEEDTEDGRERGVVKWFNVKKGFGFITWDNGEDVFVHFRSIRGQGHRSLSEGQRVKFQVVDGRKGQQAEDVSAIKE